MIVVASPTELTTGATDAVLGIECLAVLACLWRTPVGDRWRVGLWCWAFGLLAFASFLGAAAHGLEIPASLRAALWKPLYLSLGVLIAFFVVGAFFDWLGRAAARRLVPWGIGVGCVFFALTECFHGAFVLFVIYEAAAMVSALAIYTFLAANHWFKGAGIVAVAILLNLAAAGVQATHLSFQLFVPFDHNGLFHLVQMSAIAVLGVGLRRGMIQHPRLPPETPSLCH